MLARLSILLLISIWASWCPAQETPPSSDPELVTQLVRQLDDPEFAVREQALVELRQLGAAAHPQIRVLLPKASLEARLRLEGLLEEVAGTSTELEVELSERRISLRMNQITAADALALLSRKTGFEFGDAKQLDLNRIVDFELENVTALQALDEFAAFVGQRWVQDYGTGLVRFYLRSPGAEPMVSYQGPFRFSLETVALNSTLIFGTEVRSNCYLQGKIDLEPGAEVMGIFIQPQLVEALDDHDLDLAPKGEQPTNFQLAGMRRNFHFNLRFEPPTVGAKVLKTVVAEMEVVVPRRFDELALQLEGNETNEIASPDTLLRFQSLSAAGPQRRVEIYVERLMPKTQGERPVDVPYESIEIITTEGLSLRPIGQIQRQKQQAGEILRFNIDAAGGRLQTIHLKSLVEIGTRQVKLRFADVPLP